ncbi:MAG: hypothetical protein K8H86_05345 [Ignavibacteriaceae bacterium]|nr:hypothetical protein [Ignavibacteriaceae bacterium]
MKIIYSILLLAVIVVLSGSMGCKDTVTGEDIDNRKIPESNVSFAQDVYPILNVKCASSNCHNQETRAGGYAFTSWTSVYSPELLVPGDPDNSRLVWTIEARPGVAAMPPVGYAYLTANQIKGIRTWITEGAKNN